MGKKADMLLLRRRMTSYKRGMDFDTMQIYNIHVHLMLSTALNNQVNESIDEQVKAALVHLWPLVGRNKQLLLALVWSPPTHEGNIWQLNSQHSHIM